MRVDATWDILRWDQCIEYWPFNNDVDGGVKHREQMKNVMTLGIYNSLVGSDPKQETIIK